MSKLCSMQGFEPFDSQREEESDAWAERFDSGYLVPALICFDRLARQLISWSGPIEEEG